MKTPRGKVCASGSLFSLPVAASPSLLFTFLYCLKAQSSCWPFETHILSQHQLYSSGADALLTPTISVYLLEEELWLPRDKARGSAAVPARRRTWLPPAAGVQRGSVQALRGFTKFEN